MGSTFAFDGLFFSVYNAKQHPKVISGEKTEADIFKEFLSTFDTPDQPDGVVRCSNLMPV